MIIQFNSDNNISAHDKLAEHFTTFISEALDRFSNQITRVEVHLSDENSHKSGQKDKRCLLEARLERMNPIAVTEHAETIEQAIHGAIDKLKSALDSELGRLKNR